MIEVDTYDDEVDRMSDLISNDTINVKDLKQQRQQYIYKYLLVINTSQDDKEFRWRKLIKDKTKYYEC